MSVIFRSLFPILVFILLYFGSGIYLHLSNYKNAFYYISPLVFILIASVPAIIFSKHPINKSIDDFVTGISDKNILTMCVIFLLSSAFSIVTKSIGAPDLVVNLVSNNVASDLILPVLFITASIVATSLGTSMGIIALITPIALGLSSKFNIEKEIIVGVIIGAAMFGDNLSMISDTTIASVMSQNACFKKKFILNAKIAIISAIITIMILLSHNVDSVINNEVIQVGWHELIKLLPYIVLLILGILGVHAFVSLAIGIFMAATIGFCFDYQFLNFAKDIKSGFLDMQEIIVLSLFIGGIANISMQNGIMKEIEKSFLKNKNNSKKFSELLLSFVVIIVDILVANNTIAILLTAPFAQIVGEKVGISPQRRAYIIDTYSCVAQGLIPHGAQILLAIQLSGASYFGIIKHASYCWILAIVALIEIIINKQKI